MFSKRCEYGIKAILQIAYASRNDQRATIKQIAKSINSPLAFTAKVLQDLANAGIVNSSKGPTGGYFMTSDMEKNTRLYDVVKAIDGEGLIQGCGLGLKQCNAKKPCPLHFRFIEIRNELKSMLKSTTVEELADDVNAGVAFLKR